MYKQGEIILIPFPYSDLTGAKRRPALIISNESINFTDDRICCLITTNPDKQDILITKESFESGKLPFKSFVRPQRIFTIHTDIILKKLCKIKPNFYDKIITRLLDYIRREAI